MILDDSLFSGVVDFTGGSLSNVIGITGTGVLGDNTVYDISPTLIVGLTSGLSVTAFESGVLLPNTTITSIGSTTITLSNPVEYDGSTKFFISLSANDYLISNAKLVDVNNLADVNDIPDYDGIRQNSSENVREAGGVEGYTVKLTCQNLPIQIF